METGLSVCNASTWKGNGLNVVTYFVHEMVFFHGVVSHQKAQYLVGLFQIMNGVHHARMLWVYGTKPAMKSVISIV